MPAGQAPRVKGVDILPEAIELARHHAERNGLPAEWEVANAFEWLAHAAAHESALRLDYPWTPPAIAKKRGQKDSLRWAIWKLVYHALPLLAENGCLLVCSCALSAGPQRYDRSGTARGDRTGAVPCFWKMSRFKRPTIRFCFSSLKASI
ncbi:MAG: hypothetical protein KatS3mg021_0085 [Fimbriimonadales bacterium]|nr:MAG: hypothetical protein KatS3mg021_0085 [Fimbriimonadales bacterium]